MKWFKHDTDANSDNKLQNVLLDYGLEGYGLYWYCIELIAGRVDQDNYTFELEHDSRIIARNVGSTAQKVSEMMNYFVNLGLFEDAEGTVSCLKLAKRLDKSMTSNPQMREIIEKFKSHDSVMTQSAKPMQDQIRLDKTREEDIKDSSSNSKELTEKVVKSKFKFSEDDMKFAVWMYDLVVRVVPSARKPNFDNWANIIRLMRESDKIDHRDMIDTFKWANKDSFWYANILSPKKLREKFPQLKAKMSQQSNGGGVNGSPKPTRKDDNLNKALNDMGISKLNVTAPHSSNQVITINPID